MKVLLGEEKYGATYKLLAGAEACARKKSDKLELWVTKYICCEIR